MKVPVDVARRYWMHPSQHNMGKTGADLPDWAEYWAEGGVCLMTHAAFWPGVIEAHLGVLPTSWGQTAGIVVFLLDEVWREKQPDRIIAHIEENNRPTAALLRRVGAEIDGATPIRGRRIIQYGWTK